MDTVVMVAGAVAAGGVVSVVPIWRWRHRRADRPATSLTAPASSKELAIREPGRHAADPPPIEVELAQVPRAVTATTAKHAA